MSVRLGTARGGLRGRPAGAALVTLILAWPAAADTEVDPAGQPSDPTGMADPAEPTVVPSQTEAARARSGALAGPPAPILKRPGHRRQEVDLGRDTVIDTTLVGVGQLADVVSTEIALSHSGLREVNPLVARRAVRIPLKAGVAAGLAIACHELRKRDMRGRARMLAVLGFAVGAAATVHNVRMIREQ
jgi:hypothetical protein